MFVITLNRALFISMILLLSCQGKPGIDKTDKSLQEAKRWLAEYIVNRDTNYLNKSFEYLRLNREFVNKGITKENHELVTSLLMYLRKYDELENLITRSAYSIEEKEMTLNLIRALRTYDKDSLAAHKYIDENTNLIKGKLKSRPGDSLLYVNYFIMRVYQVGRNKAFSELDSAKLVNDRLSDEFCEYVLRDVIAEYPEEYLFPKE
jgi:hypothetical protein